MSDDDSNDDFISATPLGESSSDPDLSPPLMGEGPWGSLLPAAGARHDGWTGALMAKFCETLAETGIVVDACLAVGKSTNTAYANRRRDPLFASLWETALGIARNRLADALLARSIEGSVEHYYRDGALVGEKRHIDNRLGLAILRRLDRLAETGSPLSCRDLPLSVRASPFPVHPERSRGAPALDWDQMLGALRTGDPDAVATALAALKTSETHETHDPPDSTTSDADDAEIKYVSERVWDSDDGWWTDFPPPADFDGVERGEWGCHSYNRSCTDEESALLDAIHDIDRAEERAAEDAERTAYFADLAADLAAEASSPDPPPSC